MSAMFGVLTSIFARLKANAHLREPAGALSHRATKTRQPPDRTAKNRNIWRFRKNGGIWVNRLAVRPRLRVFLSRRAQVVPDQAGRRLGKEMVNPDETNPRASNRLGRVALGRWLVWRPWVARPDSAAAQQGLAGGGSNPLTYRVNYRPSDNDPWQLYAETRSLDKANTIASGVKESGYQSQVVDDLTPFVQPFPDASQTSASSYYPTSNWAADYNNYIVPGRSYNYGWYGGWNPWYGYRSYPNYVVEWRQFLEQRLVAGALLEQRLASRRRMEQQSSLLEQQSRRPRHARRVFRAEWPKCASDVSRPPRLGRPSLSGPSRGGTSCEQRVRLPTGERATAVPGRARPVIARPPITRPGMRREDMAAEGAEAAATIRPAGTRPDTTAALTTPEQTKTRAWFGIDSAGGRNEGTK